MAEKGEIHWKTEPDDHDYPAAFKYLSLHMRPKLAESFVRTLKAAELTVFQAKDIFRASGLHALDERNYHVQKDVVAIADKKELSPILLVVLNMGDKVIIADGYHRMCAVYAYDEDAFIPCKIAYLRRTKE